MMENRIREIMACALNRRSLGGAVILVAIRDKIIFFNSFGQATLSPSSPMKRETVFDIASLTKPLATTLAIMILIHEGLLSLDDPISLFSLQKQAGGARCGSAPTIRYLLNHCSGLPAWSPLYQLFLRNETNMPQRDTKGNENPPLPPFGKGGMGGFSEEIILDKGNKEKVIQAIHGMDLEYEPGKAFKYSDLGFIWLGYLVEKVKGIPLDLFCQEKIFQPLGLKRTFFIDLIRKRGRGSGVKGQKSEVRNPKSEIRNPKSEISFASTEFCPIRRKTPIGEVNDLNAYAMGGVAGHAGLFSDAHDVFSLTLGLLLCYEGEKGILSPDLVKEFFKKQNIVPNSTWALGWDTPSHENSTAGRFFSMKSVGHLGFTGCSLWMDLERGIIVVLLANRLSVSKEEFNGFRASIHEAAFDLVMKRGDYRERNK